MTDASSSSTALVAYLRCEADMAELKAKRLRQQIHELVEQHGEPNWTIVDNPGDMAPLNEFGMPKYKGNEKSEKSECRLSVVENVFVE